MTDRSSQTHSFAIMWDCRGLEAVVCVSDIEQKILFETLKTGQRPRHIEMPNLMHWRLRAQFNPQRHYEIYLCSAEPGISAEDIREMFENDPQTAADTIRRIGHRFYSDRVQEDSVVIR
jgi:hypothetical protein